MRLSQALFLLSTLSPSSVGAATNYFYWRYPRTNAVGQDLDIAAGKTIDQFATQCNSLTNCVGFNSEGFLKSSLNATRADCDLYVRASLQQPPLSPSQIVLPKPTSISNGSQTVFVQSPFLFNATNGPNADLEAAFERYTSLIFVQSGTAQSRHRRSAVLAGDTPLLTSLQVSVTNESVPLLLGVDESYSLEIPEDGSPAMLSAATIFGAYRGLETFSQLVTWDFDVGRYRIDSTPLAITDAPRFPHRGLLIDSSRHFLPVRTVYMVIDAMSYAKLNTLHWHLVDAQAWPVESAGYPQLWSAAWSPRERYTLDDLAAVVEYARQRGIRVVPEFDTPGHADSICLGYPEVCPSPSCTSPLSPVTNASVDLIKEVLGEWATIFPDTFFHLGGDEVDETCWAKSPAVRLWMAEKGFGNDTDLVYKWFVVQVDAIAVSLGRSAMRWQEVWEHFGAALPPDTVIHVWKPSPTASMGNVTSHGYRAVFSNNAVYYLDNMETHWSAFYDADPLGGVSASAEQYVLGGETAMWGEKATTADILETIFPRAAAAAERQWSYIPGVTSADPDVELRMQSFGCLLSARGVPSAPLRNLLARRSPWGPGSCMWQ